MNLYIKNIDIRVRERDLKELFGHCGEVKSVKIVINHITGLGQGYGFVEMPNEEQALIAIKELDRTKLMDSIIRVSKATTQLSK